MYFYKIALLGLHLEPLIYESQEVLSIGEIVEVPLKKSIKKGVVLDQSTKPDFKTEPIKAKTSYFFKPYQLNIAKFIALYYLCEIGEALALFVPYSKENKAILQNFVPSTLPTLTKEQNKAYEALKKKKSALLFGVTGSGKTEIYIHLIAKKLQEGKNALLLMPEIALTPQTIKRLENYFPNLVISWHSKLSKKQKEQSLEKIYTNKARVVVGARSALFLPIENLGIIIVDEEHDDSYKAMSKPRYNAKDLAFVFQKELDLQVILGSATPLVTSFYKLETVRLKKPFKEAKKEFFFYPSQELNQEILQEIEQVVKKKEQALIFVPTRANFKYLICQDCGKTHLCPYCDIGMSLHIKKRALICHYCNFASKIPNRCEYCQSPNLITKRQGTQEIGDLIKEKVKNAKVEIFDKDHITTLNKLAKALNRIKEQKANVIIGTQMLSKGHDYPEITLSIITGLDFLLALGDYRAKERAIALMHQIAGRSGRSKDARVFILTAQKEFFAPYLEDFETFIKEELEFRKELYPPFKNLARILIASINEQKAKQSMQEALEFLQKAKEIEIVGFGKSPIEKIARKWRYFILLRSKERKPLLEALHAIKKIDLIEIDMDPIDFS